MLKKHAGIAMKSEDLYISPDAVRVKYEFLNTTARDEKIIVAFPMPDITTEGVDDNIAIPDIQQPENFLDFKTMVEGQPVVAHVEQRVFKKGVEYTALLKKLGIPLMPLLQDTDAKLDKLSAADKQTLIKAELVSDDEYDVGKGMEHHLGAAWTLKTTYWWEQTFPAGKILHVEHDYKPPAWAAPRAPSWRWSDAKTNEEFKPYVAKYWRRRRPRRGGEEREGGRSVRSTRPITNMAHRLHPEDRLELGSEPIGDFRLVLDKGAATNLLSVCETGIKKIAPTQFEVRRNELLPRHGSAHADPDPWCPRRASTDALRSLAHALPVLGQAHDQAVPTPPPTCATRRRMWGRGSGRVTPQP